MAQQAPACLVARESQVQHLVEVLVRRTMVASVWDGKSQGPRGRMNLDSLPQSQRKYPPIEREKTADRAKV